MVDYGLFLSVAATVVAVWAANRLLPTDELGDRSPTDQLVTPLVAGLVLGRAVSLLFNDPAGLFSLREFLTIRGGVEFWPAVAMALLVLWVLRHSEDPPETRRVALLLPFVAIGLGAFQASCLLRDGCPGPKTTFGLIPGGLTTRQFPAAIAGGAALVRFAVWLVRTTLPDHHKILVGLFAIGGERALLGAVQPNLASALRRDGLQMLAAFVVLIAWWVWFELRDRQWRRYDTPRTT